jgi:DNA-binding MarR family transcriptional regulator
MPAVMDAMRSAMRRQVGEQLSVPQFRCLNFITQRPGSSVSAVAAFLGVTVPTASAIVDRLVRSGAVALTTAAADRRRSELHVTAAGRAHIDHIRGGARVEFARALASCNPAELHALRSGLDVLRRVFLPV